MVVLKKISIYLLFFIFSSNICYSSQILDYETEEFINQILEDIIKVNKINKKIKFKINNSNEINAFVDINNIIHINSGLIIYCADYVALLSKLFFLIFFFVFLVFITFFFLITLVVLLFFLVFIFSMFFC